MRWPGMPTVGRHGPLLGGFTVDALGTGLFLPFSLLLFTATTSLPLQTIGLALSLAAFVRIPATAASGVLLDHVGPKRCVVVSNLLQATGFTGYLAVGTFAQLVTAAVLVQLGNSLFWVAYAAMVDEVAADGEQERWFGLVNTLRAAGLGLGALLASVAVASAGTTGYRAIVVVNALSFLAAAALVHLDPSTGRRRATDGGPRGSWQSVLRDRGFVAFVGICLGFTYLSLAFAIAVPVYVVRVLDMPAWTPGVLLALNAALGALGAAPVVAAITGHERRRVLAASQVSIGVGYGCVLLMAAVGQAAALALALLAAVLVTATELVQGPTVSAVINEAATDRDRGRYIAVYQMTFSVVDIVAPGLLTWTLARGPAITWLPLIGIAVLDVVGLAVVARRLPALRRVIGRGRPEPGTRTLEADSL